jgi:methylated-DNA-protein-cysteine methyltransferase-like protein
MPYFADIQRAVRRIPRGKVATYGEVARGAGYPRRARQVARALSANGIQNLPWHRVLGSGGRILLRGEAGLHQRALLRLEGVDFRGDRVDMDRCGFRFPSSGSRARGKDSQKSKAPAYRKRLRE